MDDSLPGLLDRVSPETDITYGDLALLGAALLSSISSTCILGWSSPGSSLDYTSERADSAHTAVVRDFIAWTSGRRKLAQGCEERLRGLVDETGWSRHVLTLAADRLMPDWPSGTG